MRQSRECLLSRSLPGDVAHVKHPRRQTFGDAYVLLDEDQADAGGGLLGQHGMAVFGGLVRQPGAGFVEEQDP